MESAGFWGGLWLRGKGACWGGSLLASVLAAAGAALVWCACGWEKKLYRPLLLVENCPTVYPLLLDPRKCCFVIQNTPVTSGTYVIGERCLIVSNSLRNWRHYVASGHQCPRTVIPITNHCLSCVMSRTKCRCVHCRLFCRSVKYIPVWCSTKPRMAPVGV